MYNKELRHQTGEGIAEHTSADQPRGLRRWADALKHRWPTALGIAIAVLTFFDGEITAEFISTLSAIIFMMALIYVGAAILEQRQAAWIIFLAGFVALFVGRLLDWNIGTSLVFLVAALIFLILGVARGQLRKGGDLPLQAIGMLGFGALGLLVLFVDPTLGGYLVAAALLGHAAWDAFHFRLNRVVPRSYAEFCGVLDLVLGVAILLMMR